MKNLKKTFKVIKEIIKLSKDNNGLSTIELIKKSISNIRQSQTPNYRPNGSIVDGLIGSNNPDPIY
jgi:hypothetical protein